MHINICIPIKYVFMYIDLYIYTHIHDGTCEALGRDTQCFLIIEALSLQGKVSHIWIGLVHLLVKPVLFSRSR